VVVAKRVAGTVVEQLLDGCVVRHDGRPSNR
jgi:hypothetical protein